MNRADVEREIARDESVLVHVARLIGARAPLASWPEDLRRAFLLALDDTHASRAERWQVVALRRHLFGRTGDLEDAPDPTAHSSSVVRRRAERLRDGLTAMIAFRSGRYLRE